MANIQKKRATTYTYESVDGSRSTIQVGQDGVTKKWLAFLMEDDAAALEQEDYQRKHEDYGYRNAVARYEQCPEDETAHPMDEIPDPAADIFRILYPEETEDDSLVTKIEAAMEKLTEEQRDLIYELFGLCRTVSEIAREQDVSREAIQNRRSKIVNRMRKMIEG